MSITGDSYETTIQRGYPPRRKTLETLPSNTPQTNSKQWRTSHRRSLKSARRKISIRQLRQELRGLKPIWECSETAGSSFSPRHQGIGGSADNEPLDGVAQAHWRDVLLTINLAPLRALGFVHPPVNCADLGVFVFGLDLFDDLLAGQGDLLSA